MKKRSLLLLSLAHLAVDVTSGALPAVLPFLQREFKLSYLMLAAVATTYQVTSSIAQPIFGAMSDHGARRYLMPLGVLLAAGGFGALGVAPTYGMMLAAVALSGIGSAIFHPEATKSARYVAGEYRATGMSFFTIGGNVGVALGPLVLTGIVAWRGLTGTWLYVVVGLASALAIIAIGPSIARAESVHRARTTATAKPSQPGAMAALVVTVALRSVIYGGILVFVPLYAVNVLHHSVTENGPLLFAILGAGALATVAGAAVGDRIGHKRAMSFSFAFVPPLLAAYVLSPTIGGVVALVLAGAFLIATTTITVIMAHEYMPRRIALASALVIGFPSGIGGLVIAGLGHVADVAGLTAVLWSLVGVSIIGTALSALLPSDTHAAVSEDVAAATRKLASSAAVPE